MDPFFFLLNYFTYDLVWNFCTNLAYSYACDLKEAAELEV